MICINYFYQITDSFGYAHSIDMLYIEWYCKCSLKTFFDSVKELHLRYPLIRYEEYLERARTSKYDFYLDGVVFGTVFLNMGRYTNYDKLTKSFDVFPMFQLRFNPNKVMKEEYFLDLIKLCMDFGISGYIKKYDYAIDIPLEPDKVKVFYSRKERGLYKGTRYFGQSGRHNYLKIYDKQKELVEQSIESGPLTRVEYTFKGGQIPSFENVHVLDANIVSDLSDLKDTDKAIIEMYHTLRQFGFDYDLNLGRRKMEKLSKYLYGGYKPLEYGDILNQLLDYVEKYFKVSDTPDDVFLPVFDEPDIPFD